MNFWHCINKGVNCRLALCSFVHFLHFDIKQIDDNADVREKTRKEVQEACTSACECDRIPFPGRPDNSKLTKHSFGM